MTDHAPTEREPRRFGYLFGQVMKAHPTADVRLVNDILRIVYDDQKAWASASPPATETGGLDVGLLAEAIHAAEDPHLEGVSLKQREKAAIIVAEYSRLRSPSVGEGSGEGET